MIEFNFLKKVNLRNRKKLRFFLQQVCKREGFSLQNLSIVFCSDEALLKINRQHLGHDFYTDIITFDYSTNRDDIFGELLISVDRVFENAKQFSTTKERELHRVIFHGLLHLFGYKDKSPNDKTQMRQKEEHYLKSYFK